MFSNDIIQLIIFINNLPIEKLILLFQKIVIILEILAFIYIIYINKDY